MFTKKIFLSFLSLAVLFLGSCSVGDKLGSKVQDSQISGGNNGGGKKTNLPILDTGYTFDNEISMDGTYIPKIYIGNYLPTYYGTFVRETYINPGAYGYSLDKATYLGKNTWSWGKDALPGLVVDEGDLQIYKLCKNEKGQRTLIDISYDFSTKKYSTNIMRIHEDDINK